MNLTEMRARVREDLRDSDAANYRWRDDEIDGAIERVVREFSLHHPLEQEGEIATTEGSNELDISQLSNRIEVYAVEFPLNEAPPSYQDFEIWGDELYMEDEGNGGDAKVRWGKLHTVDAESSTIGVQFEEIIVLGATGYLASSAAVAIVDKVSVGGEGAVANYHKWGQRRLQRYEKKLKDVSNFRRLSTGRLAIE